MFRRGSHSFPLLCEKCSIAVLINVDTTGLSATVEYVLGDVLAAVPERLLMKHKRLLLGWEIDGMGPAALKFCGIEDDASAATDLCYFLGASNGDDFGVLGQRSATGLFSTQQHGGDFMPREVFVADNLSKFSKIGRFHSSSAAAIA